MVLHELLGLPEREKHVVSLCGGGGKTTLMYALARETKAILPTALFTTTHIMTPSDADVVLSVPFSAEECRAAWREGKIASSGTFLSEERKFGAPGEDAMRFLCREASAVIIEADGARRLPVKFPAAREPVIRPETTHTIVVFLWDTLYWPESIFEPSAGSASAILSTALEKTAYFSTVPAEMQFSSAILSAVRWREVSGLSCLSGGGDAGREY